MRYEMTQEQFNTLLDACKPVRLIMLQCGTPQSPQQNANAAWRALGNELKFDYMTVKPVAGNEKAFEAEPLDV